MAQFYHLKEADMRKWFFGILFLGTLLLGSDVYAQVQVDTRDLTDEQKAKLILQVEQMKKENNSGVIGNVAENLTDPQKLNEWVDLGKNVGLALTAVAKELGVAADQVLNSTTGKIAMAMIVWKVMGHDVLDIVGGVATWFVVSSVILWSFSFFHMTKRVKDKDGNVVFVPRYEFSDKEAKTSSACVHAGAFIVFTAICMSIVFG